jgi:hypothetical protein
MSYRSKTRSTEWKKLNHQQESLRSGIISSARNIKDGCDKIKKRVDAMVDMSSKMMKIRRELFELEKKEEKDFEMRYMGDRRARRYRKK